MELRILEQTKLPILILGETGTGKSHFAKKIGKNSKKFLPINIASLNSNIFESELFGHVKGAFSGAENSREGFCEAVGEGVLFIDEIGELSLEMQVKLLTLIDERSYYPVGSSREKSFRGRLIFATNKNLEAMVDEGTFREDLYYRLRLITKYLRPLRDDPDLYQTILESMNNMKIKYQSELCFSTEVMDALTSYAWPGNFRELHNTVEILFIAGKPRIELKDLPIWVCSTNKYKSMEKRGSSYYDSMAFFEMSFFNSLLERNDGKINQSAQIAGISKGTLISKLRKYGINRKEFKKVFTNIAG